MELPVVIEPLPDHSGYKAQLAASFALSVAAATAADWRSAVSRGYYAAFHVARLLVQQCGFAVPGADQAHSWLWLRLSSCGHPAIEQAGRRLGNLRTNRPSDRG